MDVNLGRLVARSCEQLAIPEDVRERIVAFLQQRLHVQIREKGYGHELSTLAVSVAGSRPLQVLRFLEVFSKLQAEQWFVELVTSAVRVITSRQNGDVSRPSMKPLPKRPETKLAESSESILVEEALSGQDWKALAESVGTFAICYVIFEDVPMKGKCNRMHLLGLCNASSRVGDLGVRGV